MKKAKASLDYKMLCETKHACIQMLEKENATLKAKIEARRYNEVNRRAHAIMNMAWSMFVHHSRTCSTITYRECLCQAKDFVEEASDYLSIKVQDD